MRNEPAPLLPQVFAVTTEPARVTLALRIPPDLAYLPGHFPGVAVVPGVVQIHWAVHFARQYWKITEPFSHFEVVKFKELMVPSQQPTLTLNYSPRNGRLQFLFHADAIEFSSGRIYFKADHV